MWGRSSVLLLFIIFIISQTRSILSRLHLIFPNWNLIFYLNQFMFETRERNTDECFQYLKVVLLLLLLFLTIPSLLITWLPPMWLSIPLRGQCAAFVHLVDCPGLLLCRPGGRSLSAQIHYEHIIWMQSCSAASRVTGSGSICTAERAKLWKYLFFILFQEETEILSYYSFYFRLFGTRTHLG